MYMGSDEADGKGKHKDTMNSDIFIKQEMIDIGETSLREIKLETAPSPELHAESDETNRSGEHHVDVKDREFGVRTVKKEMGDSDALVEAAFDRESNETTKEENLDGIENTVNMSNSECTMTTNIDVSESFIDLLFVPTKAELDAISETSDKSIKEENVEASEITKELYMGNNWTSQIKQNAPHSSSPLATSSFSFSAHSSTDVMAENHQEHLSNDSYSTEPETELLPRCVGKSTLAVASFSTVYDTVDQEEAAEGCLRKGHVEQLVAVGRPCDITEGSFEEIIVGSDAQLPGSLMSSPNQRKFKCIQCGNAFKRKDALNAHIRTHEKEKPYKCSQCENSFTVQSNLNRHMRVHTGERPYLCDKCGQSFSHSHTLTVHLRRHSGDRPFKCSHCGKAFFQSNSLNLHLRTHTGEKPNKCSKCDKCFTVKGNLNRHMRTHTTERQ